MITRNLKMSEIVLNNPQYLLALERFGIALGFGEKTIETVCEENGVSEKLFLTIANLYCCKELQPIDILEFDTMDIRKILMFLKNSHVYFLNEKIPKLKKFIDLKIENAPREKYSLLIKKFLDDYFAEVFEHMTYENNIVFPYVENLLEKKSKSGKYSMKQFRKHHTNIEIKLTDLKNLLIKHIPSEYDSLVRRKMLFELFDLERDINIHDYIENQLLIPVVERLENVQG